MIHRVLADDERRGGLVREVRDGHGIDDRRDAVADEAVRRLDLHVAADLLVRLAHAAVRELAREAQRARFDADDLEARVERRLGGARLRFRRPRETAGSEQRGAAESGAAERRGAEKPTTIDALAIRIALRHSPLPRTDQSAGNSSLTAAVSVRRSEGIDP